MPVPSGDCNDVSQLRNFHWLACVNRRRGLSSTAFSVSSPRVDGAVFLESQAELAPGADRFDSAWPTLDLFCSHDMLVVEALLLRASLMLLFVHIVLQAPAEE